jgi:glucosamine-6-phosphate deaminase
VAEIVIVPDSATAGALAAGLIADLLQRKADAVLGVATGSTPEPVYQALAEMVRERGIDVSGVRAFALDEYVGLDADDPQSYRAVVEREVTRPLGLNEGLVQAPDGRVSGADTAGDRYERAIRDAGGVDLQILGIGRNGHIGFNEPGSSLASRTRVKTLSPSTLADNSRFFPSPDAVPWRCITQGIGTILEARHLVLLAFGQSKAAAVAAAVEGPVTARCPGSAIQLHPHVTVIVDEAAASSLADADYYRYAWESKVLGRAR